MNRLITRIVLAMLLGCVSAALAAAVLPQTSVALGDPPPISGLVSPSHPVASRWYANPNPTFSWRGVNAASAIAGYSYTLDQNPATVPDATVDLAPLSFGPIRDALFGASPGALAVGDFNRDGKLDLAVLNTSSVTILFGKGNGSFGRRRSFAVARGAEALAVADLNHDGRLDLVTSAFADHHVIISVLLGRGDGSFHARRDYSGDYSVGPTASSILGPLVIGDINGDHHPDILTFVGTKLVVFLGRGDGTFGPAHVFLGQAGDVYGDEGFAHTVALGDVNGDGRLDVVIGGQDDVNLPIGYQTVLLGRGNGDFRAPVTTTTSEDGAFVPKAFALRDLNHDGKLDLIAQYGVDADDYGLGPSYDALVVSFGKGNGTFSQETEYDFSPQQSLQAFKMADFNRDGNPDLGFATNAGIEVMLGNGDGTFQSGVLFGHSGNTWMALGDFNRDGKPDLAVVSPQSKAVSIFLNTSDRAAYHGLADGVWYFHVRAVDASAVGGPTATRAVRIDTHPPSTQAPSEASVQSGGIVHLSYEVSDPPPSAGWCTVRVEVRNGRGTVLFRHTSGHTHSGVLYQTGFRCDFAKGTFRFYVYATDAAGNPQSNVAWNRLVVR